MTARQIELARHALGLRKGTLVSYRNAFVATPESPDFAEWIAMMHAGHAERRGILPTSGWWVFKLTRAGAERALLPGDVLDPEDWPTC